MAQVLGVSTAYINLLENNRRSLSVKLLMALSDAYGVDWRLPIGGQLNEPHMTRDEVLLIKGWDSLEDGPARFTPHTAFDLPDTPPTAPPRESIETRTLVIG